MTRLPVARCIGMKEDAGEITVTFMCPVCLAQFTITGKVNDPPPPDVKNCPNCKRDVSLTG